MRQRSCCRSQSFLAILWLSLTCVATSATGEEQQLTPHLSHIQDWQTDRQPLLTAFPDYPSIARRDRIEGEAIVCFRIDTNGKVRSAKIKTSSHKIFVKPTIRAMRASSFEPLRAGQTLDGSKTCRTFRYRLEPVVVEPAAELAVDSDVSDDE